MFALHEALQLCQMPISEINLEGHIVMYSGGTICMCPPVLYVIHCAHKKNTYHVGTLEQFTAIMDIETFFSIHPPCVLRFVSWRCCGFSAKFQSASAQTWR